MKTKSNSVYKNSMKTDSVEVIAMNDQIGEYQEKKALTTKQGFKRVAAPGLMSMKDHALRKEHQPSRRRTSSGAISRAPEKVLKLDKLTLAVLMDDLSADEQGVVTERLQRWLREKKLVRGSSKQKGFKNVYFRKYEDGFVLEIRAVPSRVEHAKQFMNFTFNPARMSEKHAASFRELMGKLFPGRAHEIVQGLRLYRVDVCVDFEVDVNSLIVRQRRAWVESKFFLTTDSEGKIETIYLGSIASDIRGIVYDQEASDSAKLGFGEVTSHAFAEDGRTKTIDDAEVVIKRTRFEVRRIFKDLPNVKVLENWSAPFDRWDVWQIRDVPKLRKDAAFWAYLDVVRWRGVAGARRYLTARGSNDVNRFEQLLNEFRADWWEPDSFSMNVKSAFCSSQIWSLLTK